MKTTSILFTGVTLFFSSAVSVAASYEIRYAFIDAVVVRRMIVDLPQFDRPEILGTGTLYVDGVSNLLMGQYDLTVNLEEEKTKTLFSACLKQAQEALKTGQGLVIAGTSAQAPTGGYKSNLFLDSLSSCKLLPATK